MLTPNGRFKTNKRLCLSISDFHPDTWNPAWSIATILTGLLSFMLETTPTLGSIETSTQEKRKYARQSMEFNLKDETFCELFPDIVEEINEKLNKLKELQNLNNNNPTTNNNKPLENNLCDNLNNNLTNPNSFCYSLMTNAIVLICFAIFALIVHYVFKSINVE
jgi:ubiquitin-conjugating enzyme E2 J2